MAEDLQVDEPRLDADDPQRRATHDDDGERARRQRRRASRRRLRGHGAVIVVTAARRRTWPAARPARPARCTIASSRAGATRCSCSVASASMRFGDRSVSISSRSCRAGLFLRGASRAASPRPGSRAAAARSAATPRTAARARGSRPTPTDFHSSRCRASSTSRTIGLLRTSFLMAYSKGSAMVASASRQSSRSAARSFALRARGLRRTSSSPGTTGFFVSTLSAASPLLLERAQRVLHDAVLERVERDDDEPRARRAAAARPSRESDRARRARGSPRCAAPGTSASPDRSACSRARGTARRTIAASRPVVSIGASRRAATIARAMRREKRSSP